MSDAYIDEQLVEQPAIGVFTGQVNPGEKNG